MKQKHLTLFLVAAVVLAALWSLGSTRDVQEDVEIVSQDGEFALSVVGSALPAGTLAASVAVSDATEEFASLLGEHAAAVHSAVHLEPDGLQLSEPAAFAWTFTPDPEDPMLPMLLHVSGDRVEILDTLSVNENDDGTVTMTGSVNHFSSLLRLDAPFRVTLFGGNLYDVGDSFDFTVGVKTRYAKGALITVMDNEQPQHPWRYTYGNMADADWVVEDVELVGSEFGDAFAPRQATLPGATLPAGRSYRESSRFSCVKEGHDRMRIPDGINIEYGFSLEKPVAQLAQWLVDGTESDYRIKQQAYFSPGNTNFIVRCKENPTRPEIAVPDADFGITVCGGITGIPCPER